MSDTPQLALHGYEQRSRANGPGVRFAVWFQGCSLGCPGCFNPDTHEGTARLQRAPDDLITEILAQGDAISGVTISGGEPFEQPAGLLALVRGIRERDPERRLSILVFSGFTMAELRARPLAEPTLAHLDVLIDGRYEARERIGKHLRGSDNQRVHLLTDRYQMADIEATPEAEIRIDAQGNLMISGVAPLFMPKK